MKTLIGSIMVVGTIAYYSLVGTEGRVSEIKERAIKEIPETGWNILRYQGYQRGSWARHGGKVWYHVENADNPSNRYNIYVTLWRGKLRYHYGSPDTKNRMGILLSDR
jgi:hypothetical protein